MGEIAEAMIEGECCQTCGEFFDDEAPGHPRSCAGCGGGGESMDGYLEECRNAGMMPPGDGSGKRRRRKRRRQRKKQAKRDALAAADVSTWTQLSPHHFRKMVDNKPLDWWPSTGKWSFDRIMRTDDRVKFMKERGVA